MPGNGSNGGGAAVRQAPAPATATTRAAALPAGVSVTRDDTFGRTIYSFTVGGKGVGFMVDDVGSKAGEVIFSVGGALDRGGLSGRDADRAAITIARIFKHDVSTRPDGYVYQTSAWTRDGFGDRRAQAYERAGFSAPIGGRAGSTQYGVVKGGKLQPANYSDPEIKAALSWQE